MRGLPTKISRSAGVDPRLGSTHEADLRSLTHCASIGLAHCLLAHCLVLAVACGGNPPISRESEQDAEPMST